MSFFLWQLSNLEYYVGIGNLFNVIFILFIDISHVGTRFVNNQKPIKNQESFETIKLVISILFYEIY